jgi:hypothetical protein
MKTFLDWSAYDTYGIGDAYSGIPAVIRKLGHMTPLPVFWQSRLCMHTATALA